MNPQEDNQPTTPTPVDTSVDTPSVSDAPVPSDAPAEAPVSPELPTTSEADAAALQTIDALESENTGGQPASDPSVATPTIELTPSVNTVASPTVEQPAAESAVFGATDSASVTGRLEDTPATSVETPTPNDTPPIAAAAPAGTQPTQTPPQPEATPTVGSEKKKVSKNTLLLIGGVVVLAVVIAVIFFISM